MRSEFGIAGTLSSTPHTERVDADANATHVKDSTRLFTEETPPSQRNDSRVSLDWL